jgi:hypothetical protein
MLAGNHSTKRWTDRDLSYWGNPDDTFVVSFPRSGTTLMRMLLWQILTDGNINFTHICDVSPFFERDLLARHIRGVDTIASLPHPHIIKSHLAYSLIPKGPGRYIYVMRNGLDVAVSFYHQATRRPGFRQSFPAFFAALLEGDIPIGNDTVGTWFEHVGTWWQNERMLSVLYVTYEDLIADFLFQARRVATFCNVTLSEREWERVATNCSFEFMRQHEEKFDDLRTGAKEAHYIRRGSVGEWRSVVSRSMLRQFKKKYDESLGDLSVPIQLRGERKAHD